MRRQCQGDSIDLVSDSDDETPVSPEPCRSAPHKSQNTQEDPSLSPLATRHLVLQTELEAVKRHRTARAATQTGPQLGKRKPKPNTRSQPTMACRKLIGKQRHSSPVNTHAYCLQGLGPQQAESNTSADNQKQSKPRHSMQKHQSSMLRWLQPKLDKKANTMPTSSVQDAPADTTPALMQENITASKSTAFVGTAAKPATDKANGDPKNGSEECTGACTQSKRRLLVQTPSGSKKVKSTGDSREICEDMTVMTWNVMGTTTILNELRELAEVHTPWIIVLTEHKLTEQAQHRKLLDPYLPGYKLYHSRVKGRDTKDLRSGSGGVTVAVHASLTTQNSVEIVDHNNPAAKSHCKALKIQPPGSAALFVWGLYVPCTDMQKRQQLYSVIKKDMQAVNNAAADLGEQLPYHIMAGDMNAALYDDDRQGQLDSADKLHQQLVQDLDLHSTDKRQEVTRKYTFRCSDAGKDSRIDDVLTSANLCNTSTPTCRILDTTGDSDHEPVLATIPLTCMKFCKPGPDPAPLPREAKLKNPAQPKDLQKFQAEFQLQMGCQIAELNAALDTHLDVATHCTESEEPNANLKGPLAAAGIHAQLIESLAEELQQILQHVRPISMQTMP